MRSASPGTATKQCSRNAVLGSLAFAAAIAIWDHAGWIPSVTDIAARNLVRMIAAGAAAHSDHGRDVALTLLEAARNPDSGYQIRDPHKLRTIAEEYGVETEGRSGASRG